VLIAAKNLPAYHALTDSDITIGLESAHGKVNYATLPVAGGLTLRPIEKGQPVTRKDISANVIQLLGPKVAVVGVSISRASALGGTLSDGDKIKFILTSRRGTRKPVKAVLLTVTGHGSKANQDIIVVALQARDAQRYGRLLEAGKFVMIVSAAP
jgi:Flp pilus assembly protein CpaB